MIPTLTTLLSIPSVTGSDACKTALDTALSLCGSFGFRTRLINDSIGYAEIGEGEEMIAILAHLDVVPAGEGWSVEPFAGTLKDGRIYGRGTADDKGPAVAAMFAMRDLLEEGVTLRRRIRLIFGTMEEGGDWEDMEYYKANEEAPVFGFTPDADFPAIYGEKGILHLDLSMPLEGSGFRSAKGGEAVNMVAAAAEAELTDGTVIKKTGRSAHASYPERGRNAVTELMEEAQSHGAAFADFYMQTIGWDLNGERIGIALCDEQSGILTLNVGTLSATAEEITIGIDIRYPVTFTEEEVQGRVEEAVRDYGVSVKKTSGTAPIYMDKDKDVIRELMAAYREVTKDPAEPIVIGGGTYARAMEGIVAFGPHFPGKAGTEHQANEYLDLEDLESARQIYKRALLRLAQLP